MKPWRVQRAWEAVSLDLAQTASRRAQNAATIDHAINAGIVLAGQVGTTEGQQTVSPAGTAASETTKGAVAAAGAGEAVSAEAVTANVANLFTSLTPVIASALAAAISQTIAALVPVVVTASGGASTPSQTQPKPRRRSPHTGEPGAGRLRNASTPRPPRRLSRADQKGTRR